MHPFAYLILLLALSATLDKTGPKRTARKMHNKMAPNHAQTSYISRTSRHFNSAVRALPRVGEDAGKSPEELSACPRSKCSLITCQLHRQATWRYDGWGGTCANP